MEPEIVKVKDLFILLPTEKEAMLRVSLMSWYRREPVRLVSYQNVLLRIEHHWFGNTEYIYPLDSLCLFACLPPNRKKQYKIFKLFSWSYLLQMYQIDSATHPYTGQQEWTISPFCWPWLKGVPMSMPRDMLERLLFT